MPDNMPRALIPWEATPPVTVQLSWICQQYWQFTIEVQYTREREL